ncbi:MAG: SDR family oxidoreductase [Polyangiaceae bacterium]|jgi:NAD(P)-dependent dehydrogenase (short-subunit alcohol dehydrogenase family)
MGTALVTGSNRGIGLELVRQLRDRGHTVIAGCRKPSSELKGLGVRVEPGVDVTSETSVRALADRLQRTPLDLLIHNAGLLSREHLDALDFDAIRRQLEVNALGPLRVTAALSANLARGSKIVIVTSRMGSIADNTSGGYYGYRMSKAAANMVGASLARDLKARGIAVALVHPGFVRTEMTGRQGNVDAKDAARDVLARSEALTLDTSGGFWHAGGERLPW